MSSPPTIPSPSDIGVEDLMDLEPSHSLDIEAVGLPIADPTSSLLQQRPTEGLTSLHSTAMSSTTSSQRDGEGEPSQGRRKRFVFIPPEDNTTDEKHKGRKKRRPKDSAIDTDEPPGSGQRFSASSDGEEKSAADLAHVRYFASSPWTLHYVDSDVEQDFKIFFYSDRVAPIAFLVGVSAFGIPTVVPTLMDSTSVRFAAPTVLVSWLLWMCAGIACVVLSVKYSRYVRLSSYFSRNGSVGGAGRSALLLDVFRQNVKPAGSKSVAQRKQAAIAVSLANNTNWHERSSTVAHIGDGFFIAYFAVGPNICSLVDPKLWVTCLDSTQMNGVVILFFAAAITLLPIRFSHYVCVFAAEILIFFGLMFAPISFQHHSAARFGSDFVVVVIATILSMITCYFYERRRRRDYEANCILYAQQEEVAVLQEYTSNEIGSFVPLPIARAFASGKTDFVSSHPLAAVAIVSIDQFVRFSATRSPMEILNLLQQYFIQLDKVVALHPSLVKLHGFGDQYVCVSGIVDTAERAAHRNDANAPNPLLSGPSVDHTSVLPIDMANAAAAIDFSFACLCAFQSGSSTDKGPSSSTESSDPSLYVASYDGSDNSFDFVAAHMIRVAVDCGPLCSTLVGKCGHVSVVGGPLDFCLDFSRMARATAGGVFTSERALRLRTAKRSGAHNNLEGLGEVVEQFGNVVEIRWAQWSSERSDDPHFAPQAADAHSPFDRDAIWRGAAHHIASSVSRTKHSIQLKFTYADELEVERQLLQDTGTSDEGDGEVQTNTASPNSSVQFAVQSPSEGPAAPLASSTPRYRRLTESTQAENDRYALSTMCFVLYYFSNSDIEQQYRKDRSQRESDAPSHKSAWAFLCSSIMGIAFVVASAIEGNLGTSGLWWFSAMTALMMINFSVFAMLSSPRLRIIKLLCGSAATADRILFCLGLIPFYVPIFTHHQGSLFADGKVIFLVVIAELALLFDTSMHPIVVWAWDVVTLSPFFAAAVCSTSAEEANSDGGGRRFMYRNELMCEACATCALVFVRILSDRDARDRFSSRELTTYHKAVLLSEIQSMQDMLQTMIPNRHVKRILQRITSADRNVLMSTKIRYSHVGTHYSTSTADVAFMTVEIAVPRTGGQFETSTLTREQVVVASGKVELLAAVIRELFDVVGSGLSTDSDLVQMKTVGDVCIIIDDSVKHDEYLCASRLMDLAIAIGDQRKGYQRKGSIAIGDQRTTTTKTMNSTNCYELIVCLNTGPVMGAVLGHKSVSFELYGESVTRTLQYSHHMASLLRSDANSQLFRKPSERGALIFASQRFLHRCRASWAAQGIAEMFPARHSWDAATCETSTVKLRSLPPFSMTALEGSLTPISYS